MTSGSITAPEIRLPRDRLTAVYERGLERCRGGEWKDGLVDLALVAERGAPAEVPALCYSYLGYGLARHRGQLEKGIRLCRHAVKQEFYQPECYVNLARAALLSEKHRKLAANAILDGLEIDGDHPELRELQRQVGARRPPVIGFLSRRNILNQILGWFRYQFRRRPKPPPEAAGNEPRAG